MQYVWQPREWDPQQAEKLQVGSRPQPIRLPRL